MDQQKLAQVTETKHNQRATIIVLYKYSLNSLIYWNNKLIFLLRVGCCASFWYKLTLKVTLLEFLGSIH